MFANPPGLFRARSARFANARRTAPPVGGPQDFDELLDVLSQGGSEDDSLDDFLHGHAAWKAG